MPLVTKSDHQQNTRALVLASTMSTMNGCSFFFFFFSSRRRHTRCSRDWSSDVCSSDLGGCYREPRGSPAEHARVEEEISGAASVRSHVRAESVIARSEERRVGKECRSRWSPYH